MKNTNFKEIANNYLKNNNILDKSEFRNIWRYDNDVIKDFVECSILYYLEEWDLKLEKLDTYIASNEKSDYNYYSLLESYQFFENWIDINEKNELSVFEFFKMWQKEWYNELFSAIKEDFLDFFESKIK